MAIFLIVNVPINALMVFVLIIRALWWMKLTAAAVVAISLYTLYRGYVTRLTIDSDGIRLRRIGGTIHLPWNRIQRIGMYAPGGGVGAAEYVYVTTRSEPPTYKWEIDETTIQVQGHPGLLDAIEAAKRDAQPPR